ncbi:hypothetical protein [Paractinoplanes hotanensis]|uniref:Uncharacterized protein n=1 Tax=Paractinoplanes hotanensis TaxID=2906497 RepID=A0ABT0Y361_9ACTN|nr:hypothetical protein [Actinoplanes hotanensis]MCM4080482.1 hypothetical protein [Actinoplanes hotanensis]
MSQLPEPLRASIAERDARPPIQKVRDLLRAYVLDTDGFHETRAGMADTARYSTRSLRQELEALEWALEADLPPGTLLHLVEDDANRGMDDDPTDAGAAVFLRQVAVILREVLDSAR